MSDFIFSSRSKTQGELTKYIQSIYHSDNPTVTEYHGFWGSVAVSKNLYYGFQPLENKTHIFIVLGGPVLYFRNNNFLTGNNPFEGTTSIYNRYRNDNIQWDEDLSGPFVILIINKQTGKIQCVTDLMMFIPVYQNYQDETLMLSTHVDTLAKVSNQDKKIDKISVADFILTDVVTYPHTIYQNIFQLQPASIHFFKQTNDESISTLVKNYWSPKEENLYSDISLAATYLRKGITEYIDRLVENMDEVAQFLSAGEDSRSIAGLLPNSLKKNAYIFLDSMNKEGRIAKQVAEKYKMDFHVNFRDKNYYLTILEEASDLIGNGQQYFHAHSLGFHKKCGLKKYPAVFGGFSSDTLLKGYYIKESHPLNILPFMPNFYSTSLISNFVSESRLIQNEIIKEINHRHKNHLKNVKKICKNSAREWFSIWPISMGYALPNFHCTRRLFRSYEPFMSKEVVKISASVPLNWKLNRRLFNKAMRPFLRKSQWILHPDGFFPSLPWWFNSPIQFIFWSSNIIKNRIGLNKVHQGPWSDWNKLTNSEHWNKLIDKYASNRSAIDSIFTKSPEHLLKNNKMKILQKINLLQTLYKLQES